MARFARGSGAAPPALRTVPDEGIASLQIKHEDSGDRSEVDRQRESDPLAKQGDQGIAAQQLRISDRGERIDRPSVDRGERRHWDGWDGRWNRFHSHWRTWPRTLILAYPVEVIRVGALPYVTAVVLRSGDEAAIEELKRFKRALANAALNWRLAGGDVYRVIGLAGEVGRAADMPEVTRVVFRSANEMALRELTALKELVAVARGEVGERTSGDLFPGVQKMVYDIGQLWTRLGMTCALWRSLSGESKLRVAAEKLSSSDQEVVVGYSGVLDVAYFVGDEARLIVALFDRYCATVDPGGETITSTVRPKFSQTQKYKTAPTKNPYDAYNTEQVRTGGQVESGPFAGAGASHTAAEGSGPVAAQQPNNTQQYLDAFGRGLGAAQSVVTNQQLSDRQAAQNRHELEMAELEAKTRLEEERLRQASGGGSTDSDIQKTGTDASGKALPAPKWTDNPWAVGGAVAGGVVVVGLVGYGISRAMKPSRGRRD